MYDPQTDDLSGFWETLIVPMMRQGFYPEIQHFGTEPKFYEWHVWFWRQGRSCGQYRGKVLSECVRLAKEEALREWPKVKEAIRQEKLMAEEYDKESRLKKDHIKKVRGSKRKPRLTKEELEFVKQFLELKKKGKVKGLKS